MSIGDGEICDILEWGWKIILMSCFLRALPILSVTPSTQESNAVDVCNLGVQEFVWVWGKDDDQLQIVSRSYYTRCSPD